MKVATGEGMKDSLLRASEQHWKLLLAVLFVPALGLTAVFAALIAGSPAFSPQMAMVAVGGIVLSVLSYVWGLLFIRCPRCRVKLLWLAFTEQTVQGWLSWLLDLEQCPKCGCDGGAAGI